MKEAKEKAEQDYKIVTWVDCKHPFAGQTSKARQPPQELVVRKRKYTPITFEVGHAQAFEKGSAVIGWGEPGVGRNNVKHEKCHIEEPEKDWGSPNNR